MCNTWMHLDLAIDPNEAQITIQIIIIINNELLLVNEMKASRRHYDICTNESQKKNKNGCFCLPFKKRLKYVKAPKKGRKIFSSDWKGYCDRVIFRLEKWPKRSIFLLTQNPNGDESDNWNKPHSCKYPFLTPRSDVKAKQKKMSRNCAATINKGRWCIYWNYCIVVNLLCYRKLIRCQIPFWVIFFVLFIWIVSEIRSATDSNTKYEQMRRKQNEKLSIRMRHHSWPWEHHPKCLCYIRHIKT